MVNGDLQRWVQTQWQLSCKLLRDERDGVDTTRRGAYIQALYPELLQEGYSLPLHIVIDLITLYLTGPEHELYPPDPCLLEPGLVRRYCDCLNQRTAQGSLREALLAARRYLYAHHPVNDTVALNGVRTFLKLAAAEFARHEQVYQAAHIPAVIRQYLLSGVDWLGGLPDSREASAVAVDPAALEDSRQFLQALCPPSGAASHFGFEWEELQDASETQRNVAAELSGLTAGINLQILAFGDEDIRWSAWPPPPVGISQQGSVAYRTAIAPDGMLRHLAWEHLLEGLWAM